MNLVLDKLSINTAGEAYFKSGSIKNGFSRGVINSEGHLVLESGKKINVQHELLDIIQNFNVQKGGIIEDDFFIGFNANMKTKIIPVKSENIVHVNADTFITHENAKIGDFISDGSGNFSRLLFSGNTINSTGSRFNSNTCKHVTRGTGMSRITSGGFIGYRLNDNINTSELFLEAFRSVNCVINSGFTIRPILSGSINPVERTTLENQVFYYTSASLQHIENGLKNGERIIQGTTRYRTIPKDYYIFQLQTGPFKKLITS